MPPLAYCAPALGNRTKAGCVHLGEEGMAVRTPDLSGYRTCPDTGPEALRLTVWLSYSILNS